MKSFDYLRPESIADAQGLIDAQRLPLAGGTDLVPLLKDGVREPAALVDIKRTGLPSGICKDDDTISLGALTTLSELERDGMLRERFPLLGEAARLTATRQLRNRATIGGNLLQASRCWYYRHPDLECWLRGGEECFAKNGRNERHAVMSKYPCVTVHPSDLAGCLLALDASVCLQSASGRRELPLSELLVVPAEASRALHKLGADELVTEVRIPLPRSAIRSTYLKAMSREAWTFALVGVAAVLTVEREGITSASVVLNGVAPKPWRLADPATNATPLPAAALLESLGEQFERDAEPLEHNAYKIPLARALMAEAIDTLSRET
jgi:xanthine dehydrogenase YagS FAD-binding subunit